MLVPKTKVKKIIDLYLHLEQCHTAAVCYDVIIFLGICDTFKHVCFLKKFVHMIKFFLFLASISGCEIFNVCFRLDKVWWAENTTME